MQICIKKSFVYASISFVLLVLVALILNAVLRQSKTVRTKAAEETNVTAIKGGTPTSIEKWPFIVALIKSGALYSEGEYQIDYERKVRDLQFCAGSVVGAHWIVTAAHCVYDTKPQEIQIVFGQSDLSKHLREVLSTTIGVKRIISASYDITTLTTSAKKRNDIALLELIRDIPATQVHFSQSIITNNDGGQYVYTAGWGYSVDDNMNFRKEYTLNEIGFPLTGVIETEHEGGQPSLQLVYIPPRHSNIGTCFGDSGGPLIGEKNGEPYLIGVVSFTTSSCEGPYTFTNVGLHKDWINPLINGGAY